MAAQKRISFSPPDITEAEIAEVVDALRSGWITTGPKTKQLEHDLAAFTRAQGVACLSSATAALECALRALGIGPGDEVITSAYTYTASCSPICHVGATPVLCDTAPGSFEMDYEKLPALVSERTRAVIPVDIAGRMCDYDKLRTALENVAERWNPTTERQRACGHLPIVADAAHALGATYRGKRAGEVADMTTFSFHAVKNFTTAEGGALAWRAGIFDSEALYQDIMLTSLHGQTKDALAKTQVGAWEYDIAFPGWKCNMTDMAAGMGLAQLRRYPGMLARRREMIARYEAKLHDAAGAGCGVEVLNHYDVAECDAALAERDTSLNGASPCAAATDAAPLTALDDAALRDSAVGSQSSGHLMLVRLPGASRTFRDALIVRMAEAGVATNVHYKPLPLLTAYRNLGFDIADFPNALAQFENEITLPLHTLLSDEDIDFVVAVFKNACSSLVAEGLK